jgi:hypothetical protein
MLQHRVQKTYLAILLNCWHPNARFLKMELVDTILTTKWLSLLFKLLTQNLLFWWSYVAQIIGQNQFTNYCRVQILFEQYSNAIHEAEIIVLVAINGGRIQLETKKHKIELKSIADLSFFNRRSKIPTHHDPIQTLSNSRRKTLLCLRFSFSQRRFLNSGRFGRSFYWNQSTITCSNCSYRWNTRILLGGLWFWGNWPKEIWNPLADAWISDSWLSIRSSSIESGDTRDCRMCKTTVERL